MSNYYDQFETRESAKRQAQLLEAIRAQLGHAQKNAPAYAATLAKLDPSSLSSLDAIADLPITRKSDLLQKQKLQPPFGGLSAVKPGDLRYVFASPGPIYEPETTRPDYWRLARAAYAAGIRKGDLIHSAFSYHLTPAGSMVDCAARTLGCAVIPAGVGQTDMQIEAIVALKPKAYIGTPSFLKIIIEQAAKAGADISSLKLALVSGEAFPNSTREFLADHGVKALQCYASADLGMIAYESSAQSGLIVDEGVYLEIVRPGTGDPVPEGEVGEVVVTTLNPDYPLIRFATGDLSAIASGVSDCGRTNTRIKGWMGRADQTTKVRGMFVHPEQIAKLVKHHPQLSKARLLIDWRDGQDQMVLKCELQDSQARASDDLKRALEASLREYCKLRGEIELLSAGSLANDGIVIEDVRKYD